MVVAPVAWLLPVTAEDNLPVLSFLLLFSFHLRSWRGYYRSLHPFPSREGSIWWKVCTIRQRQSLRGQRPRSERKNIRPWALITSTDQPFKIRLYKVFSFGEGPRGFSPMTADKGSWEGTHSHSRFVTENTRGCRSKSSSSSRSSTTAKRYPAHQCCISWNSAMQDVNTFLRFPLLYEINETSTRE